MKDYPDYVLPGSPADFAACEEQVKNRALCAILSGHVRSIDSILKLLIKDCNEIYLLQHRCCASALPNNSKYDNFKYLK